MNIGRLVRTPFMKVSQPSHEKLTLPTTELLFETIFKFFSFLISKPIVMNGNSKIRKWKRSHLIAKHVFVPTHLFFGLTKTQKLTLVEINFQTKKLFEKTNDQLYINHLLKVMLHNNDNVICMLKDRHTSINQMWNKAPNLTILLIPCYENIQHIHHNNE